jgi:hypothetical protein
MLSCAATTLRADVARHPLARHHGVGRGHRPPPLDPEPVSVLPVAALLPMPPTTTVHRAPARWRPPLRANPLPGATELALHRPLLGLFPAPPSRLPVSPAAASSEDDFFIFFKIGLNLSFSLDLNLSYLGLSLCLNLGCFGLNLGLDLCCLGLN